MVNGHHDYDAVGHDVVGHDYGHDVVGHDYEHDVVGHDGDDDELSKAKGGQ